MRPALLCNMLDGQKVCDNVIILHTIVPPAPAFHGVIVGFSRTVISRPGREEKARAIEKVKRTIDR